MKVLNAVFFKNTGRWFIRDGQATIAQGYTMRDYLVGARHLQAKHNAIIKCRTL